MVTILLACVVSAPVECGAGTHLDGSNCVADGDTGDTGEDAEDSATDTAEDSGEDPDSSADSADDTGSGSEEATVCPDGAGLFESIQEAIDAAGDGDTITVCPGTYDEALVISHPITLASTSGAAVTAVDGGLLDTVVTTVAEGSVVLQGFSLVNGRGPSGGAIESDGTDLTILDCVLQGNDGDDATILVEGGSIVVQDSEILDSVAQYAAVLKAEGADVTMERVLLEGNEAEDEANPVAILLDQAGTVEIFNVLAVGNDVANAVYGTWHDLTFVNNTLVGRMIMIQGGPGGTNDARVENNILSSPDLELTYAVGASLGDVTFQYNDYDNFMYGLCAGSCSDTEPVDGNIDADPRFNAPASGDYSLDALSPCINAGNPAAAYDDPDGTRADMGAYGGQQAGG